MSRKADYAYHDKKLDKLTYESKIRHFKDRITHYKMETPKTKVQFITET
jgi:hypothetical protein